MATGKQQQITISGIERLSKDEVDRLVKTPRATRPKTKADAI